MGLVEIIPCNFPNAIKLPVNVRFPIRTLRVIEIIKNSDEKKILVDWSKCDDARKPRYCYGSDFKLIPKSERKKIQNVTAIEPKYYRLAQTFFNNLYGYTGKYMRFTAPQRDFKWENLPTDSDAYLFPVMSKKYLKKIGYKK